MASKRKSRVPLLWKQRLEQANAAESDIRRRADWNGLSMQTLCVDRMLQWVFRRNNGEVVGCYWVETGRVWSPLTGERWLAADVEEAFTLVKSRKDV